MKAISLWQPWASAVALGLKQNETRGWWTAYRGPLAIHAAKRETPDLIEFYNSPVCRPLRAIFPTFHDLPRGAVVATVNLKECLRTTDVDCLTQQEKDFGDYSAGRFAWIFTDIKQLPKPVPFRGAQMFFEWPCDADDRTMTLL